MAKVTFCFVTESGFSKTQKPKCYRANYKTFRTSGPDLLIFFTKTLQGFWLYSVVNPSKSHLYPILVPSQFHTVHIHLRIIQVFNLYSSKIVLLCTVPVFIFQ